MKRRLRRTLLALVGIAALATAGTTVSSEAAGRMNFDAEYGRLSPFILDPAVVMPELTLGPQDNSLYRLGEIDNEFSLIEGLSLYTGLNIDVASVFDGYAKNLYGLFPNASALTSPYLSLANGSSYAGVRLMLADGLRFSFGQAYRHAGSNLYWAGFASKSGWSALGGGAAPFDRRNVDAVMAGLSWDFAKWGSVNLTASQINERGSLALGNAASLGGRQTTALGISTHVGLGSGWVTTVSYNQANSQLSLKPIGGTAGDTVLRSQSYGIAVAKHGLFGNDALGLSLSRPAGAYNAVNNDMQFQFYGRDKLFARNAPETDIELGYVTTLLDGPLALQANASYQMNYNGPNRDAIAFMSRAKIKF